MYNTVILDKPSFDISTVTQHAQYIEGTIYLFIYFIVVIHKCYKIVYINKNKCNINPILDHLMQFCTILGKKERSTNNYPKYIEVENLTPRAINNFKQAIVKSNV